MFTVNKLMYFSTIFWLLLKLSTFLQAEVLRWTGSALHVADVDRVALWYESTLPARNGVVVLCPGQNGSGKGMVTEKPWVEFAQAQGLGLVALSFASPVEALYAKPGKGYYYAEQGSGEVLLEGIREIYGERLRTEAGGTLAPHYNDAPGQDARATPEAGFASEAPTKEPKLLLFGFSGGAIFIAHFVKWKPERVLAWSAYSASFWPEPVEAEKGPPGIVACGEFDSERYGPTFAYFQQGRRVEAQWIWLSLKNTGHMRNRSLERFTRDFFADVLAGKIKEPVFLDAERKIPMDENELLLQPSMTVWLPNPDLAKVWQEIHHP
jgi:hypothetical protein